MFPEAGGSSSFARRAFNEFWSFFAAWGQMLNYTITIAISAFFVPHYIGGDHVGAAAPLAGRHHRRHRRRRRSCRRSTSSASKESAGVNVLLAVVDFCTQLLLVVVGAVLVLSPDTLVNNVHLGVAPTWKNFLISIPVAMIAYTGIETISNMAEEAKDEERTIPRGDQPRRDRRVRHLRRAAGRRAERAARHPERRRHLPDAAGPDRGAGRLRRRPDPRRRQDARPRRSLQQPAEIYVGLLAATILFIATNAGIIGVSRLVYSMGLHRQMPDRLRQLHPKYGTPWIGILVFGTDRLHRDAPGPGRLPRLHVRVRRDALVLDRARVGHPPADHPARPQAPVPRSGRPRIRGYELPLFALVGDARHRRWRSSS